MPTHLPYPTQYPDVNALFDRLLPGVKTALGDQFIGMYLHGSLAMGDFDPRRSDLDFLVVTRDRLSAEMVSALAELHAGIAASDLKWTANYEGSYIPQDAIRRYNPSTSVHPVIRGGYLTGLDEHRSEWVIQRHAVRERGIVISGPSPESLIDPISPDELRMATSGVLREWWTLQLDDPFRLYDHQYQAYAILTMCRALYTLEFGAIASKPQAGLWALQALDGRWGGLIEGALAWEHGVAMNCLRETLDFIRFTLELSNQR